MIPAISGALRTLEINPTEMGQVRPNSGTQNDFAAVLAQVADGAVETMKAGEAASIRGVRDEASTQAVVEAVMSAERTLQTAVALRDKAINAYLELSRMAI